MTHRYERECATNAGTWYRIDKATGAIAVTNGDDVLRAANGSFKRPNHVIASCRFQTPFAYYSTGDQLTADEQRVLDAQEG